MRAFIPSFCSCSRIFASSFAMANRGLSFAAVPTDFAVRIGHCSPFETSFFKSHSSLYVYPSGSQSSRPHRPPRATPPVQKAEFALMTLCIRRLNCVYVPEHDFKDAIRSLGDLLIREVWDWAGGKNRLSVNDEIKKRQQWYEERTRQQCKEIDWYRSQGLACVPWFEGAKSGDCLNFFEQKTEDGKPVERNPEHFPWFYEPLAAFDKEKQVGWIMNGGLIISYRTDHDVSTIDEWLIHLVSPHHRTPDVGVGWVGCSWSEVAILVEQ